MLPEEQLVSRMLQKRAGIWDLYGQQNNLGGSVFTRDEDPLTSLLGNNFNDKYRAAYQDTLTNNRFGKGRLTSRTGARLLNDINDMNERGQAALVGLLDNKERTIAWLRDIHNSRIGVGGYTSEDAARDIASISDKLNDASRFKTVGGNKMLTNMAQKYMKGQFNSTIDSLSNAINTAPTISRPFIKDIRSEFTSRPQSISPQRQAKDSLVSDTQSLFSGAGDYLMPALLLGVLGGGASKMFGGSFSWPLLLALLGGAGYGIAKRHGYFGGGSNGLVGINNHYTTNNTTNNTTNTYNQNSYTNNVRSYMPRPAVPATV